MGRKRHPAHGSTKGLAEALEEALNIRVVWPCLAFSRVSSQPRNQTHVSYIFCIDRWVLYH